jgi:hypothetical protein
VPSSIGSPANSMSPEDLLSYWRRTYGDAPLVGHALRERFPQRWLRIHNLPDAKRYAETEDERREILRRQNELFSELLGDGGPGEFIFGYYGEEERLPEEVHAALRGLRPEFLRWRCGPHRRGDGTARPAPAPLRALGVAASIRSLIATARASIAGEALLAPPAFIEAEDRGRDCPHRAVPKLEPAWSFGEGRASFQRHRRAHLFRRAGPRTRRSTERTVRAPPTTLTGTMPSIHTFL